MLDIKDKRFLDGLKLLNRYNPCVQMAAKTGEWSDYELSHKDDLLTEPDLKEL